MAEHGQLRDDDGQDAEREARRRLALARIRQYGDPALRLRAGEVEAFDDDLGRLIEGMTALMHDANGVGLAGNEVGVLRRVFVFTADEEDHVVAHPVLVESSDETAPTRLTRASRPALPAAEPAAAT